MSRRILKFEVPPGASAIATADVPRFLSVGHQREVVVWCEATPGTGVQTRFYAAMTGEQPPLGGEYIGTTSFVEHFDRADIGLGGKLIVVHVYREPA